MTNVERLYPGFQWAEPLNGNHLDVKGEGDKIRVTGRFPRYEARHSPCDLIGAHEEFHRKWSEGQRGTGLHSPAMGFASANDDSKLVDFVRGFGPVVAESIERILPDEKSSEFCLVARQDLQELKNEHAIFHAALRLVRQLTQNRSLDPFTVIDVATICDGIQEWPQQWQREKDQRGFEPKWNLTADSLARIEAFRDDARDLIGVRIVLCELLNTFRDAVFPNPLELHSSIEFGIRPLLYSLLRRQFIAPQRFSICANEDCRDFFIVERSGMEFCKPECSRKYRQRIYWQDKGKERRQERTKARSKK